MTTKLFQHIILITGTILFTSCNQFSPSPNYEFIIDAEIDKNLSREKAEAGMRQMVQLMDNRLRSMGFENYIVERLGSNNIKVQVYTISPDQLGNWLTSNVELYFFEVLSGTESLKLFRELEMTIQADQTLSQKYLVKEIEEIPTNLFVDVDTTNSTENSNTVYSSPLLNNLISDKELAYMLRDTALIKQIILEPSIYQSIPDELSLYWLPGDEYAELLIFYNQLSSKEHWLDGKAVKRSAVTFDVEERPEIEIEMNERGASKWKILTRRLSSNPEEKKRIAVIVNDSCLVAPFVQTEIPNGKAVISGGFTLDEARGISSLINGGSLPFKCKVKEVKKI